MPEYSKEKERKRVEEEKDRYTIMEDRGQENSGTLAAQRKNRAKYPNYRVSNKES